MAIALSEIDLEAQTALEIARECHEKYLLHNEVKDLNLAIDYYIKAVKLNPNMPETYYRMANLLYENGQISVDGAIEQCRAAIKVAPDNADAHLYMGYFLTLAGRYIEANYEMETAIKLDPVGSARARLTLAKSLLKEANISDDNNIGLRNKVKAIYYMTTGSLMSVWNMPTLKMIMKNLQENFSLLAFGLKAETYKNTNNVSKAIETYDIAAERTGCNEIFYSKMGDICIKNDAPEVALDSYRKVISANPYNRDILVKIATVIQTYFKENIDEAVECYNRLLEIEPENPQIYYELGHIYLDKNEMMNSANAFKLALKLDKKNAFIHNSLAYSLLQLGLTDEAIEHYKEAINLNPDNEWTAIVAQALGTIYLEIKNNPEAAIAMYQTALVLYPDSADIYISIGDAFLKSGDNDLAIKYYCDAIKVDENSFEGYSKCAMALWNKEYLEEAIIAYNKALKINPDSEIVYNNLGVIYLDGIGNVEYALECFENAYDIDNEYTMAVFNLARAHQELGNVTLAAEFYNDAKELNKISNDIDEKEIEERIFSLFRV